MFCAIVDDKDENKVGPILKLFHECVVTSLWHKYLDCFVLLFMCLYFIFIIVIGGGGHNLSCSLDLLKDAHRLQVGRSALDTSSLDDYLHANCIEVAKIIFVMSVGARGGIGQLTPWSRDLL
jgi:hypothetical protein